MDKTTRTRGVGGRPGDAAQSTRPRWTLPLLAALLVLVFLIVLTTGVALGYQVVHSSDVYPGVRVGSVQLGGMPREKAIATLRPMYEERAKQGLSLRMADIEQTVSMADLGVTLDPSQAVDAAFEIGRKGGLMERFGTQFQALRQGYQVETPGVKIDRTKLDALLAKLVQQVDRPVKDAQLQFGDGSVRVDASVVGRKLDTPGSALAIERAVGNGTSTLDLPVTLTQPKRTEKDLEEARVKLSSLLSGPVTLEFEGRKWSLTPKDIVGLVAVDDKGGAGAPAVSVRDDSLKQYVEKVAGEVDQPKSNARLDWNGGNLKVIKQGQDGRKLNREKALTALTSAITGSQRTVSLPVEVDAAVGGSSDLTKLGIKERIEYGQTTVAGVPEKVYNIKLASSRLNGTLVAPGETFSFNKELGPTTLNSGFQIGFGISVNNGEMQTVPSVAGGICQVATTLLHAVFWAGYPIEERYPHMYWISSYGQPPKGITGLDTTVEDPVLDFKFINSSDSYLLIQSSVVGTTLEFALYGTKPIWKVDVEGPIITNVVKADPATVRQEEPTWNVGRELWVERATDGMDVDIIRKVTQGSDVRTLHLKSRYQPSRNVLMVGTKGAQAAPAVTQGAGSQSGTPAPAAT
ncbi:MAG TPA: peptidoglycan binding domain-containing protein, partial [Chloroflexota bacterium]|nr:peptidoglycan binding domain-containing protein [Chloroflexota bacterium]